jgi:hypothetical protein
LTLPKPPPRCRHLQCCTHAKLPPPPPSWLLPLRCRRASAAAAATAVAFVSIVIVVAVIVLKLTFYFIIVQPDKFIWIQDNIYIMTTCSTAAPIPLPALVCPLFVIGDILVKNMVLIPLAIDPFGRFGPLLQHFLFNIPPTTPITFTNAKPNATLMYSKIMQRSPYPSQPQLENHKHTTILHSFLFRTNPHYHCSPTHWPHYH